MAIASEALTPTASRSKREVDCQERLKTSNGEIVLEDFGVSIGGSPEAQDFMRSNLVRAAGALLNNAWEPVIIERADTEIELRFAREILRLRGAEVLEPEIDAGQPARIRLTLVPWAGPDIHKLISVPIPEHMAGQTISLELSPLHEDATGDRNRRGAVRNRTIRNSLPIRRRSYTLPRRRELPWHVPELPARCHGQHRPHTSRAPEAFQPCAALGALAASGLADRVSVTVRRSCAELVHAACESTLPPMLPPLMRDVPSHKRIVPLLPCSPRRLTWCPRPP